ncbi:MAG: cytochrome c oxidase subunit II, partial [Bacteroidota bacterium]
MIQLILVFAAILIVGIFLAIFRISTLASAVTKKSGAEKDSQVSSGNSLHGALFIILPLVGFGAAGWYGYKYFGIYSQPHASKAASQTEPLFWLATAIIIAMFVITNVALFYFAYKYRYRQNGKAHFYPDNTKLEIIWTIVPAIILTTLIFTGWKAWRNIMYEANAPKNAQVIEIMGYQFAWMIRYAGEDNKIGRSDFRYVDASNAMGLDFTDPRTNDDIQLGQAEIHVVKGKPVELKIRARDVLHSVSIPHFRQKMDAVPGMPTRMTFIPTKTTAEMRQELSTRAEWQVVD